MKDNYPKYKKGEVLSIEGTLGKEEKTILNDFLKLNRSVQAI